MQEFDNKNEDFLNSLPDFPIPETHLSAENISDVEIKLVDFPEFIDFVLQIKADGKQVILKDMFGNSITACTVGAFRSPILGLLLNNLGINSVGSHKIEDGMSITGLIGFLSTSTVSDEGKAISPKGESIDTVFMLSDLGNPKYGAEVKRMEDNLPGIGGAVSRVADTTAMLPAQLLGAKNATKTKVVVINAPHLSMKYLSEKKDKLLSSFPEEIVDKIMQLVDRNV